MFKRRTLCVLLLGFAAASYAYGGSFADFHLALTSLDAKTGNALESVLNSSYAMSMQDNNNGYKIINTKKTKKNIITTVVSEKLNEKLLFTTIKPEDSDLYKVEVFNLKTSKKKMLLQYSNKPDPQIVSYTVDLFDADENEVQSITYNESKKPFYIRLFEPQKSYEAEAYLDNNGKIKSLRALYYPNSSFLGGEPTYGVEYTCDFDGTEHMQVFGDWSRQEGFFHIINFQNNIEKLPPYKAFFSRAGMTEFLNNLKQ